ncbi:phosphatase PAP2 family protein [Gloeothece verrucosa]|uniref:Phosphoesterase PA-phosphatase related protein n=1 Tax=Gloeothece verrucosa (strain PCC 7822) TaxID=497965 RepID=E0U7M0_GLOV7|nr:phosphatase PAP2 family protein [Gloeothece verrucosa]ADN14832.1 phosphoesterase PA-phosphatase related protein [Gloeothece verrucosa PCC 7822]
MINYFKIQSQENLLVQSLHTAIKGRARYKIPKLYHSKSLKTYLEDQLSQTEGIKQVRANPWSGNILITFSKKWSHERLTLVLKEIVLNYPHPQAASLSQVKEQAPLIPILNPNPTNPTPAHLSVANGQNKAASWLVMKMLLDKQIQRASQPLISVWAAVSLLGIASSLLYVRGLDKTILLLIQKLHTPLLDRIMLGLTFLGEPVVILLICMGIIISPSRQWKRSQKATTLGIATLGGIGLNYWLKVLFGRIRPALWERLINVSHHSFPSGHAMMSMITYGLLGYLLGRQYPQWRRQIYTVSLILILGIGFSRLYLGVHWPTDVLAGYAVGLIWLSICILAWEGWNEYKNPSIKESLTSNQIYSSPRIKMVT